MFLRLYRTFLENDQVVVSARVPRIKRPDLRQIIFKRVSCQEIKLKHKPA